MKRSLYVAMIAVLMMSLAAGATAFAKGHTHTKSHTPKGSTRSGKTISVRLCSSAPYGVPALKQLVQGIWNGVKLADANMSARLKAAGVNLMPPLLLDDALPDGSKYGTDQEHTNALKCLADPHAMGYVGTLNSGAALVSEPVLNKGFMVMISPANTNPGLTSPKPYSGVGGRAAQEPATASHQIPWVTYYRTVTTDALQGPAGAIFAHANLHAKTFYVVDDKLTYGAGLAQTFTAAAKKFGMTEVGSGHIDSSSTAAEAQTAQAISARIVTAHPDVVYCGCDSETSLALPRDLRQKGYTKPYLGGDALQNTAFITDTGPGALNDYATSIGPPPQLTSSYFRQLYKQVMPGFYSNPGPQSYDATSYDAARIILLSILHAKKAGQLTGSLKHMREMVVKYVHSINYFGAVGHTSFDSNGDTTNHIISEYKVQGKNWAFVREVKPVGYQPA